jgi:hypothetical protein
VNPELGDRIPLRLLREGDLNIVGPEVMAAARASLPGGSRFVLEGKCLPETIYRVARGQRAPMNEVWPSLDSKSGERSVCPGFQFVENG